MKRTHLTATEKQTKDLNAQFTGSSDTIENNVLRKIRERREAEKKAEKEAMEAHSNVKSTKTLVDKAAEEQRLRKTEDRRIGKLPRHPSCFQTGSLMFDVFCTCVQRKSQRSCTRKRLHTI